MRRTKEKKRKYNIPLVDAFVRHSNGTLRAAMLPIKVVSEANMSEHWSTKRKRKKSQQQAVAAYLSGHKIPRKSVITFTKLNRVKGRKLDKDNLAGAFKHVQDAVADLIGIDDGESCVQWEYGQMAWPKGGIGIDVRPMQ